jgi:uncharacterized protein YuzE
MIDLYSLYLHLATSCYTRSEYLFDQKNRNDDIVLDYNYHGKQHTIEICN